MARRRLRFHGLRRVPSALARVPRGFLGLLPSALTIGNTLCGFAAVAAATGMMEGSTFARWLNTSDPFTLAAAFIFLGMFFDMLDGPVARATGRTSDFGAELDSLADVVSFGVAPAFLLLQFSRQTLLPLSVEGMLSLQALSWFACLVYLSGAALRLARFNVQRGGGSPYFTGLPSPAAALLAVCTIRTCAELLSTASSGYTPTVALVAPITTALAGFLMVSGYSYQRLFTRLLHRNALTLTACQLAAAMVVVAVSLFHAKIQFALTAAVASYALSGIARWVVRRVRQEFAEPVAAHETVERTA